MRPVTLWVLAAVLIAGCGGGSGEVGASPAALAATRGDAGLLDFVRCVRARGIDMPDPVHRPGHIGLSLVFGQPGPAATAAYTACQHFIQPLIEEKQAHARAAASGVRLPLIHYAECMREHGIPMLDPDQFGSLSLGNVPGISNDVGRYSPQFHLADLSCRRLLPASVHDNGSGP